MFFEGLTRRIIGPYYHSRHLGNPRAFSLYQRYKARNGLPRKQLIELQNKKLKKILIHARDNTDYYRQLFSDYSFDPDKFESPEQLQPLPALTKDIIRDNIDRLLATNIGENDRHKSMTGGTTGVRMDFYRDNACRPHRVAVQWRSDNWAGWNPHDNIVYLWPIISDLFGKESIKDKLISRYVTGSDGLYFGKLEKDEFVRAMRRFINFRPKIIRCFPTAAKLAAEYLRENNLSIPSLKSVVSTGEPLYTSDRKMLEDAFGSEIYDLYASREVGTIASECSAHQDFHLAVDSLFVEITDHGKQMPIGEYGEILITDLQNLAMPLIRYTIGDYGQLSDGYCSCGMEYPLMKNIVGRTADLFYDEDGEPIITMTLEYKLIDHGPEVGQMQLVQKSVKEVLVRITDNPVPDNAALEYYTKTLKKLVKGVEKVEFEIVHEIEKEKSGKCRFSICLLSQDEIARLKKKRWGK